MKSFRTLHVGVGGRGRYWLRMTTEHKGFQPVALVDPLDESIAKAREELPHLKLPVFKSVKEAAGSVDADIAIVAAAATARFENCTEAINAGMHLLVEKPFALTLADGKSIVNLAKRRKRQIVVGQNYRYRGPIAAMAAHVRKGTIGKVGAGNFFRSRRRFGRGTYQQHMRHSYLWEMSVHDFDLIRFTLGLKPRRAIGWSKRAPWGDFTGEIMVQALFEFEKGVRVNYFGTWGSAVGDYSWRIDGANGALRATDALRFADMKSGEWNVLENARTDGDWGVMKELVTSIRCGKSSQTSGRDNLWTLAMMQAVMESTKKDDWVKISA